MGGVAWTEEEDHLLRKCIQQHGEGKWHRVPLLAGLNRCRKSCRLRWLNYLRPNIKRGSFAEEEVEVIVKLHKLLGNRWSLIAGRLPGRTANDVKNYWNCHLSKKLNAQERETVGRNAQVIKPQPRNMASSSVNGKSMEGSQSETPAAQQEISRNGIVITPASFYVNGQGEAMFQSEEDSKYSCLDQQGNIVGVGDLPMEFEFEQVRAVRNEEGSNQWDWDDLLLDMDLYNGTL